MTLDLICNANYDAKTPLPEKEFLDATVAVFKELLGEQFESAKLRDFFVCILPLLHQQPDWTPYNLFKELAKDPVKKDLYKSHTNVKYYMDQLVKLGVLNSTSEGKGYRLNAPELQRFNLLQQIRHPAFKDLLEMYYSQIYILTCVLARNLREIYRSASEAQVFDLSHHLIDIGTRLSVQDLTTHPILQRQCRKCYYPFPENPEESEKKPEVKPAPTPSKTEKKPEVKSTAETTKINNSKGVLEKPQNTKPKSTPIPNQGKPSGEARPATPKPTGQPSLRPAANNSIQNEKNSKETPNSLAKDTNKANPDLPKFKPPLLQQVRNFIYDSQGGASLDDLTLFFFGLGIPEKDVEQAVVELINVGDIWKSNENGKYMRMEDQ